MKVKLVWPSIAEEMSASAERRRLQRDRELRRSATNSTPSSTPTPSKLSPSKQQQQKPLLQHANSSPPPLSSSSKSKQTPANDQAKLAANKRNLTVSLAKAKANPADENKPPLSKQKQSPASSAALKQKVNKQSPASALKQKPLTYYFAKAQAATSFEDVAGSSSSSIPATPPAHAPPKSSQGSSDSPTPIPAKKSKKTMMGARIESPAAIIELPMSHPGKAKNGGDVENGAENGSHGKKKMNNNGKMNNKDVVGNKNSSNSIKKKNGISSSLLNKKVVGHGAGIGKSSMNTATTPTAMTKKRPSWVVALEDEQQWREKIKAQQAEEQALLNRRRMERLGKSLKKALITLDRQAFAREMQSMNANAVTDELLAATIPSPFIRYLVAKEAGEQKLKMAMRAHTLEERRTRKREHRERRALVDNAHFEGLLARFMAGKCDELTVLELKRRKFEEAAKKDNNDFEQVKKNEEWMAKHELLLQLGRPLFPQQTGDDAEQLSQHFGRCLQLSQFLSSHRRFLGKHKVAVTAQRLLEAMDEKWDPAGWVEAAMAVLVNFVAAEEGKQVKPKVETSQRSLRSRSVKMKIHEQLPTFLDTVKLLLADVLPEEDSKEEEKEDGKKKRENKAAENEEEDVEEEEAVDEEMEEVATFVTSLQGTKKLAYQGHLYYKQVESGHKKDSVKIYWVCDLHHARQCPGSARTVGRMMKAGTHVQIGQPHNHPPYPTRVEKLNNSNSGQQQKLNAAPIPKLLQKAFAELEAVSHFYQMSIPSQLAIFEHFVHRIEVQDSFHAYMDEEGASELADAQRTKAALQETTNNLRVELLELEANHVDVDSDPGMFTRLQLAEAHKNGRLQSEKRRELAQVEETLAEASRRCRLLHFASTFRTVPLGQDRLNRNFWFFADSPDGNAIFIEQKACQYPNCPYIEERMASKEERKDKNNSKETGKENAAVSNGNGVDEEQEEEEQFMQKFQERVDGRPCAGHTRAAWWALDTVAEFDRLCDCLLVDGVREHPLRQQLLAHKDLIVPKLKQQQQRKAEAEVPESPEVPMPESPEVPMAEREEKTKEEKSKESMEYEKMEED